MPDLWSRLNSSLSKTRTALIERFQTLLPRDGRMKEETWEELEEILLTADVGPTVTEDLIQTIKAERVSSLDDIRTALAARLEEIMRAELPRVPTHFTPPLVILVVGVNGVGKTTSIAKLARKFRQDGQRVILAACDTFRAAAVEQLSVWANRVGAELIAHQEGSDPAAVAYDAVQAAIARRAGVLILDTAGRLQTKTNLMQELLKIRRVLGKARPDLPRRHYWCWMLPPDKMPLAKHGCSKRLFPYWYYIG